MTSDDCRKLAVEAERRGMWSEAAQLWKEAIARCPDKSNTIAALRDIITCNSAPSVPLRWKRIAAEGALERLLLEPLRIGPAIPGPPVLG